MNVISKEQYEDALKSREYLITCLNYERKYIKDLLDNLCKTHKRIESYEDTLKQVNENIEKYDIYQEILNSTCY